ncbi:MAG: hypothetical protein U1E65_31020 [Myxococcota bacterium]
MSADPKETLATAASLLLTKNAEGIYAFSTDNEKHLQTLVEASALTDEPQIFREKIDILLALAHVLRAQEGAKDAADAIGRAVRDAPTAYAALGLSRDPAEDVTMSARAFEAFVRTENTRRAPKEGEPAPPGTFKPPRPLKG